MEDSRNLSSLCLSEPAPQEETLANLHLLLPLICFCLHQGIQGTSSCGHKVGTDGLVINEFFHWLVLRINPPKSPKLEIIPKAAFMTGSFTLTIGKRSPS